MLVNAHIMLANVGGDAYVFNCDVDEFLVTDNRTTLTELSEGCFRNESADLPRCALGSGLKVAGLKLYPAFWLQFASSVSR